MQEARSFVRFVSAIGVFGISGACYVDNGSGSPTGNRIAFTLDDKNAPVEQGISLVFLDETKQFLGPNSHLYVEARLAANDATADASEEKIRLNIPRAATVGTMPVRFSGLPNKDYVWVQYKDATGTMSEAYSGSVNIQTMGGVGGRLVATFDHLALGNACGDQHVLSNGRIDVTIASEEGLPASEVDSWSPTSEWAAAGATEAMENAMIFAIDGYTYACDYARFRPTQVGANDSVPALEVQSLCGCGYNPQDGSYEFFFGFDSYLPPSGDGIVLADNEAYTAFLFFDVDNTPHDFTDDIPLSAIASPKLRYQAVLGTPGTPLEIELASSVTFALLSDLEKDGPLDPSRTMSMTYADAYGLVSSP